VLTPSLSPRAPDSPVANKDLDADRLGRAFPAALSGSDHGCTDVHIDFESMLGTILGGPPRPAQRRAGFAIQLLNLSRFDQYIELDLSGLEGLQPVEGCRPQSLSEG
jgi:hypothetical protein